MTRYRSHLLKYTGEFVVIFCSITFTWWFDEWRQEKSDREEEVRLLINLNSNLSQDSLNLASEFRYIAKSELIFEDFLYKIENKNLYESDSSGFMIRRLIVAPEFHPNRATFEGIKSTGELKLIADDSLTQSIMNLYEVTYPELEFLINIYNQTSMQTIWNYSIENYDLRRVLADPKDRIFKLVFRSEEDRRVLINKIMFTRMAIVFSKFRINKSLESINKIKQRIHIRLSLLG